MTKQTKEELIAITLMIVIAGFISLAIIFLMIKDKKADDILFSNITEMSNENVKKVINVCLENSLKADIEYVYKYNDTSNTKKAVAVNCKNY